MFFQSRMRWRVSSAVILLLVIVQSSMAADVIVVRPRGWAGALKEWKAYRESQGHRIVEIDSATSATEIRQSILRVAAAEPGTLKFILLASDAGTLPHQEVAIPAFYHPSTALVKFRGDKQIAADSTYGDLDGDNLPDVAVGRIPADSAHQLSRQLARVIAFEQNHDTSRWRRDVHVIAGVGGFGALADGAIELTTRRFLSDRIPGWAAVSMTQASPQSPFCPDPWRFSETTLGRLNQGGMFWVYIGHGHVNTLDYLRCDNQLLPIMTNANLPQVRVGERSPIALFLACYTGAFDAIEDSLAEQMVTRDNGVVAAIAASRVSGPYGLAMLSNGLLKECFVRRTGTLGEVLLNAKRDSMAPPIVVQPAGSAPVTANDPIQLINALATALVPEGYDLAAERQEHVWMMNLLGDPLLRLNYPIDLQLDELPATKTGDSLTVSGKCPLEGNLQIELAWRRDQTKPDLDQADAFSPDIDSRNRAQEIYEAANSRVIVKSDTPIASGDFSIPIVIPSDLPRGKYCVRAFLSGETSWAVGYQVVAIKP